MPASASPFRTCWSVGGVGFHVEWDDAALTDPMEATLSYFGSRLEADRACDARVRLLVHAPPRSVPRGAERLNESREGLEFYRSGGALYLHFRGTTVRVDPRRGTAFGSLAAEGAGSFAGLEEPLRNALLYCLFYYSAVALLYHRGLRTAHAAGLVRDGHGCLLVGQSDSGKSTLTMRLVEAGWSYLSDDAVLLGRGGAGDVEARPLRLDFCLDPEAEALFPQVAPHWGPHLADVRKRRLRIRSLYPAQAASRCVPRVVVFPRVVPEAESRLVPRSQKAALVGLLHHTGSLAVLSASTGADHLEDLRRLTGQARCYTLLAGRDLRDDPGAATALTRLLMEGGVAERDVAERHAEGQDGLGFEAGGPL